MDFWGALRVMRRRWYVLVPALVIAALLASFTFLSISNTYQSTAVLVLTAPYSGAKLSPGTRPEDVPRINPLLAFDGSLSTTAQIMAQILRDPATAKELGVVSGSKDSYTITNGDLGGPFVFITVDAGTAERSVSLTTDVVARVVSELQERQRELQAPEQTFITTQTLVKPTPPEAQIGSKIRFAGAALVVGLFVALLATFAADSAIPRMRRNRLATSLDLDLDAPLAGAAAAPDGPRVDAAPPNHYPGPVGPRPEPARPAPPRPALPQPAHPGPVQPSPVQAGPVQPSLVQRRPRPRPSPVPFPGPRDGDDVSETVALAPARQPAGSHGTNGSHAS